jgi:hypothetical protein
MAMEVYEVSHWQLPVLSAYFLERHLARPIFPVWRPQREYALILRSIV